MSNAMRLVVVVLAFTLVSSTALAGAANATTGGLRYNSLAQIIDYTNQNVLKRMQLVFDADILLETSQAAGKGIFKPNEVPAQTVAEMLRKSQREGYGLLTGKNLATNEIKEELKVIRISHAPTQTTKIGEQKFKGVANLRYGKNYPDGGGFGFVHAKEHWTELAAPFDLKTDDDLISLIDDAMQNMASAGDIADPYRFYYRQEGKPRLRIVMSSSSPGSFQTLRIDPE